MEKILVKKKATLPLIRPLKGGVGLWVRQGEGQILKKHPLFENFVFGLELFYSWKSSCTFTFWNPGPTCSSPWSQHPSQRTHTRQGLWREKPQNLCPPVPFKAVVGF